MGNWVNKEWSQIETLSGDEELSNGLKKLKLKTSKKRQSLNNSNDSNVSSKSSSLEVGSTPITSNVVSKLMISDFDPRSPSSDIVRTPICFVDNDKSKKQSSVNQTSKIPSFDPRSPTNEYNRTPIHLATNNKEKENENEHENENNSLNLSVASFSLDSSSLVCSDSSMLLQQVPDNCLTNTSNIINNASCNNSVNSDNITPSKLHKLISSNLPRHILQRKQVAKLNKKKLMESNKNASNQDKENNIINQ